MEADIFRVFPRNAINRRKRKVGVCPRGPHHIVSWPGGSPRHHMVGCLLGPLHVSFGLYVRDNKIGTLGFVSSNSENISKTTFLKYKNSKKQELTLWYLVNRLVPENA